MLHVLPMVTAAADYNAFNDALDTMLRAAGPMAISTTYFPDTLPPELKRNRNFGWITDPLLRADNQVFLLTIKNNFRPHAGCYVEVNPSTTASFGYEGGYLLFPHDMPMLDSSIYTNYPDEYHRLLVMFKFWNIISYFNPYNYVLDKPIDSVLTNNVVNIDTVTTAKAFYNGIIKITACLDDAHVEQLTYSEDFTWPNEYLPELLLRYIQGKYIVVKSGVPEIFKGDAIISVDGRTTSQWEDSLRNYVSAGNISVFRRFMCQYLLLWGAVGSTTNVVYADTSGATSSIILSRPLTLGNSWFPDVYYPTDSLSHITYTKMDCDIGYVNTSNLSYTQADNAYSKLRDAPAIIVDLRSSTSNDEGADELAWDMIPSTQYDSKFTMPDTSYPGTFYWYNQTSGDSSNSTPYEGTVILLINEETQSHTEYYSMVFSALPKVIKVGSQTAGADGNVTYFRLAPDIHTGFTNLGTYFPNGDSTQRIGIVPDSVVTPTIAGIMQGRDEVLEKALQIACSVALFVPQAVNEKNSLTLYPNPTTSSLAITASYRINSVAITNLLGQTVYRNEYNSEQVQVDVSGFPPGVYFIKVNGSEVRKFVKE